MRKITRALLATVALAAGLAVTVAASADGDSDCHPAYHPCLPKVDDINCDEIDTEVTLIPGEGDPYGLDNDGDGIGCDDNPTPTVVPTTSTTQTSTPPPSEPPAPTALPAAPVVAEPAFTG